MVGEVVDGFVVGDMEGDFVGEDVDGFTEGAKVVGNIVGDSDGE